MTSDLPTDHAGLAVLPWDDCLDRIRRARVGRVAFLHSGEPVILPVNHEMDGETIVFRSAPGSKLSAAGQDAPVSFEVDAFDVERRTGWSVVVRGTATPVGDPPKSPGSTRSACCPGPTPSNESTGSGSGPTRSPAVSCPGDNHATSHRRSRRTPVNRASPTQLPSVVAAVAIADPGASLRAPTSAVQVAQTAIGAPVAEDTDAPHRRPRGPRPPHHPRAATGGTRGPRTVHDPIPVLDHVARSRHLTADTG